ncbi:MULTISPECIES: DUF1634 domain-containing protein [Acidobacteriaceae]|uniref:DUF1634 domain-containing protein n=1 Tax=Acidobacteriaceae TaxID=204434 RepID=UPI00131CADD0|nr:MULTISPECIES: DUF1634 domain-containing protein [Acidobacteriaceae]MDW5267221.1 DUF1634 domain-containing protein [Edaphobacter sp.]
MALQNSKFDDRQMETMMGRLLQIGVLLASLVVLVGGVLYVRKHFGSAVDYRTFAGEPANLRSVRGLFHLLMAGDPAAVIQIGAILLIATPIARVVFAIIGFALERDRFYVAVSMTVLAVLMASLLYSA